MLRSVAGGPAIQMRQQCCPKRCWLTGCEYRNAPIEHREATRTSRPRTARYNDIFMGQLLAGKTALVLGVANKWSIAFAISSAFVRQGASLLITYQGERQRQTVEELGAELKAANVLNCDVTKQQELDELVSK